VRQFFCLTKKKLGQIFNVHVTSYSSGHVYKISVNCMYIRTHKMFAVIVTRN